MNDVCELCLIGEHEHCMRPGQDECCKNWSRIAPKLTRLKAYKFIAEQVPVPSVGVYSGCATVVVAESMEAAREAAKNWAAQQSPPDDVRWVDYCPVQEVELKPGAVLLFVMQ